MRRNLVLNIAPISFGEGKIKVGLIPFGSREQLAALRRDHDATHVFKRSENLIQCVRYTLDGQDIGDTFEESDLAKYPRLGLELFRSWLINHLCQLNRRVLGHEPVEFVANGPGDDFLKSQNQTGTGVCDWISVNPLFEVSLRTINDKAGNPQPVMLMNVRTVQSIAKPCNELLGMGVDLKGLYVGLQQKPMSSRLSPHLHLLGRVRAVRQDTLLLDDSRTEMQEVSAADAYVEPHGDAFVRCLRHAFGSDEGRIRWTLGARLADFRNGKKRLDRLNTVREYFAGRSIEVYPGIKATIAQFIGEADRTCFPSITPCPPTVFAYGPSGIQTDTQNDRGLTKFGPYTASTFTPSRPNICMVCRDSCRGDVEAFLGKWLNGLTSPQGQRNYYQEGLLRKYHLDGVNLTFFTAENSSADAYRRAARAAIERSAERKEDWNLALVQIEQNFRDRPDSDNPYLVTKAAFLTHQIPTQEFQIEKTSSPITQLSAILNTMSLAIYAKLGGLPWLLKADQTIAHELIIGLGSAYVGEGRFSERNRMVGITTVFSGDGNYRVWNLSQSVPFEGYQQALLDSLNATIKRVSTDMNWQPRDSVRLIFHSFKPMKDMEAIAVKELVSGLGDFDVEYAFVHVVESHPWLMFDTCQSGHPATRGKKGVFAPDRGLILPISQMESLVVLTGGREVKKMEDGIPFPVLLRLHRDSTFRDLNYISRQVLHFSAHTWRSFFPAKMPVTVLYSHLIASLLGHLGRTPSWNPDVMVGKIGRTRWFL